MLGLFTPKCPVNTHEKTWTEVRLRWLASALGIDRLLNAEVVVPTEEFFPGPYRGTPEDAQDYFNRLRGRMGLASRNLRLEICADEQLPDAAGHYVPGESAIIRLVASQLTDPMRLIATLAHELAHDILLGGQLLPAEAPDHEWVTDLVPVFLGLGIFAANSTMHESHGGAGQWSWWQIGKQGYLPARIFGYALALFAFMRGEHKPTWSKHLRLDASAALEQGLRYLQKTNDTLFHPDTVRDARRQNTATQCIELLRTGTASQRVAALWDIEERQLTDAAVVAAVTECLMHKDPAIGESAGRALAALGPAAHPAVPQLLHTLANGASEARAGAAYALGVLGERPDEAMPALTALLAHKSRAVAAEAALAMRRLGRPYEPAAKDLLAALRKALIDADHASTQVVAGTMWAVTADPKRLVRDYFSDGDNEMRVRALAALKEQRAGAEPRRT